MNGNTNITGTLTMNGSSPAITWGNSGNRSTYGQVTIGDQGTTGSSLFVNTPGNNNTNYGAGLGIYGSMFGVGTNIVNLTAYGYNHPSFNSNLVFSTTLGTTVNEAMRILSTGSV